MGRRIKVRGVRREEIDSGNMLLVYSLLSRAEIERKRAAKAADKDKRRRAETAEGDSARKEVV